MLSAVVKLPGFLYITVVRHTEPGKTRWPEPDNFNGIKLINFNLEDCTFLSSQRERSRVLETRERSNVYVFGLGAVLVATHVRMLYVGASS